MTKAERKSVLDFYLLHDWSFQLVADHFGLTRDQIAGLVFRHRHPAKTRVGPRKNKSGTPRRGCGLYPRFTAQNTRDVGRAT